MSENVNQKWNKISKKPKGLYVFVKVPFIMIIPLMILLMIINHVYSDGVEGSNIFISSVIKIVLAYLLGVIVGQLEWNFYKNLSERNYTKASQIRNKYLLIYGFLSFGVTIMISRLEYQIDSIRVLVSTIILWPLAGLVWGIMMWFVLANGLTKYLDKV